MRLDPQKPNPVLDPERVFRVQHLPDGTEPSYGKSQGSDGVVWAECFREPFGYRLRFSGICDFLIGPDGEDPHCLMLDHLQASDVMHLFETHVSPMVMGLTGRAAFHGSCVAVEGSGVVFMGETGRGKSTLAASFASNGQPFLTDDLLLIDQGIPPIVRPHHNNVRLWNESVRGLFPPDQTTELYSTYTSKQRLNADGVLQYHDKPLPVAAAFVLEKAEREVSVRRLEGHAAHRAWMKNMFVLDPDRTEAFGALFAWSAHIAGHVPTYQLSYPRDFDLLPNVRRTIIETAFPEGRAA